jgi:hypothetical protein
MHRRQTYYYKTTELPTRFISDARPPFVARKIFKYIHNIIDIIYILYYAYMYNKQLIITDELIDKLVQLIQNIRTSNIHHNN